MEEKNGKDSVWFYCWNKLTLVNLKLFLFWQIMAFFILFFRIIETSPNNATNNEQNILRYDIILTVGIVCIAVFFFVVELGWFCILYRYFGIIEIVNGDICDQERQIAALERMLNQRSRLNFVRLDNGVAANTEIRQIQKQLTI